MEEFLTLYHGTTLNSYIDMERSGQLLGFHNPLAPSLGWTLTDDLSIAAAAAYMCNARKGNNIWTSFPDKPMVLTFRIPKSEVVGPRRINGIGPQEYCTSIPFSGPIPQSYLDQTGLRREMIEPDGIIKLYQVPMKYLETVVYDLERVFPFDKFR